MRRNIKCVEMLVSRKQLKGMPEKSARARILHGVCCNFLTAANISGAAFFIVISAHGGQVGAASAVAVNEKCEPTVRTRKIN